MGEKFRVGLTRDILDSRGEPAFGATALGILGRAPGDLEWEYLPKVVRVRSPPIMLRVTTRSMSTSPRGARSRGARADCRLRVVARHGVGYDSVDVAGDDARRRARHAHAELDAAARRDDRADVHPGARRQAVPQGSAHAHRALARADGQHGNGAHRTHARRRSAPAASARSCCGWRATFDVALLATDPYVERDRARLRRRAQGRSRHADRASRTSSSSAACSNDETRHLIGARAVRADEAERVLHQRRARTDRRRGRADRRAARSTASPGAALDVFEQEPVDPANPLLTMDNVIVTPHSLCWTDECFHNMAATGLASIVDALAGRRAEFVVNPRRARAPARRATWLAPATRASRAALVAPSH